MNLQCRVSQSPLILWVEYRILWLTDAVCRMCEIRQTHEFSKWLSALRDPLGRAKILIRIDRLSLGLSGDVKHVGDSVSELRIDHGPGYRVYFARAGKEIVLLLAGGDKSSQDKDIKRAKQLLKDCKGG